MDYFTRTRKLIPLIVATLTILTGMLVLTGWALDLPALKSVRPDWVSMKANTALGFILAGLSLFANSWRRSSTLALRLTRLFALLFGLIGLLTLGEYLFGVNPGFDQWLFVEPAGTIGTSHPGRMAPDTAACFGLLAAAILLTCGPRGMLRLLGASILGSLTLLISLTNLLTYLSGDFSVLSLGNQTIMAAHTSALFLVLSIAFALPAWEKESSIWHMPGKYLILFAFWNLMIGLSLTWNLHQEGRYLIEAVKLAARTNINKDLSFRRWATSHGGVYVPPSKHTPPNPYLKVPDRDVVTTSGKALTLMNPAYMLRQMQQDFGLEYGNRSSLTSLKLLNPANAPDAWQRQALSRFTQGDKEFWQVTLLEGQLYLRMIRPMFVEAGCLNCHAQQGYNLGDIRGGVETSIAMAPFIKQIRETNTGQVLSHAGIWLLGLSGLLLFTDASVLSMLKTKER